MVVKRLRWAGWLAALVALACGGVGCGEVGPSTLAAPEGSVSVVPREAVDGGPVAVDGGVQEARVSFTLPMAGQTFARSGLDMGDWVARVAVTVAVAGVHTLEIQVDGDPRERREVSAADETLELVLRGNGTRTLTAVGFDAAGAGFRLTCLVGFRTRVLVFFTTAGLGAGIASRVTMSGPFCSRVASTALGLWPSSSMESVRPGTPSGIMTSTGLIPRLTSPSRTVAPTGLVSTRTTAAGKAGTTDRPRG